MTSSSTEVTTAAITETPQTIITPPPGAELGTATMTPDGALIAVPVTGEGADLITRTAAGETVVAEVFSEPERKIARVELGARADRLVLQVTAGNPFEGQLAAWDAAAQELV